MTVVVAFGVAFVTALALTRVLVWARDRYNDPQRTLDRVEHAAGREYRATHPDWPLSPPSNRRTY